MFARRLQDSAEKLLGGDATFDLSLGREIHAGCKSILEGGTLTPNNTGHHSQGDLIDRSGQTSARPSTSNVFRVVVLACLAVKAVIDEGAALLMLSDQLSRRILGHPTSGSTRMAVGDVFFGVFYDGLSSCDPPPALAGIVSLTWSGPISGEPLKSARFTRLRSFVYSLLGPLGRRSAC